MRSRTTRQFRTLLDNLPEHVRQRAERAYELFRENPRHPGLHFKQVNAGEPPIYSVRVGLRYRALGVDRGDYMLWFWIGTHAEYDHLLGQL